MNHSLSGNTGHGNDAIFIDTGYIPCTWHQGRESGYQVEISIPLHDKRDNQGYVNS